MLLLAGFALLAGCRDAGSLIEDQTEDMNTLAKDIEDGKSPEEYQELAERIRERGAEIRELRDNELTEEEWAELEKQYGKQYKAANVRLMELGMSRESAEAGP
jgi:lipoate-protein ligase A